MSDQAWLEQIAAILSRHSQLHGLEMRLYREFGLKSPDELLRLALFLLVHAAIDRHLIVQIAKHMMSEAGRGHGTSVETMRSSFLRASEGTFAEHLNESMRRGFINGDQRIIAEKVNTARNGFLHWRPGQLSVPKYEGKEVTTSEGLEACLAGALKFFALGGNESR